ncbi:PH domain-containing protein [Sporosarcina oncorhynchi]|uniref:PH domain-containing protein n=1 Tax=Sporosarcina oncorhynchi TaxID=3056444 RepID=A0ABZ0L431_9BACL|nr:PH domain-containing protein [Sporosarcina sp. T2O-4]WOV86868.1 PH domain-containing protein [Sporosarcina sp. T2O-4]
MYFPSKKDVWLTILVWGLVLFYISAYIFGGEPIGVQLITYKSVPGILMTIVMVGFLMWLWFGTGYKVEDGLITIRFGPFKSKVKIADIRKLRATKNPLSAPALSISRIEIAYGAYGMTLVSPKDRVLFIKTLLKENPTIEVDAALYT